MSTVAELFDNSSKHTIMSVVNFTEVCSSLAVWTGIGASQRVARHLRYLVTLEEATRTVAEIASRLKYAYRMALGDTYAVATAISHDAPVWTGDAELLCDDRIWRIHDLRAKTVRAHHENRQTAGKLKVGRRTAVQHLDQAEISEYVTAPLVEAGKIS